MVITHTFFALKHCFTVRTYLFSKKNVLELENSFSTGETFLVERILLLLQSCYLSFVIITGKIDRLFI